jgi:enoyl-CoA hydratase/carnithine racemase
VLTVPHYKIHSHHNKNHDWERGTYLSDYQTISIEKKGQVDWLTLNRPEALNSITTPMVTELRDYFGGLAEDRFTRIVVLKGAGRAFCAGLDIKEAQAGTTESPYGGGMGFQGYLAEVYIRMRRCPQPIISLVNGPACGGGFSFVLASDIRIAGKSARMNAAYIRIGLSACDMGCSYFLPRLVGTSVASELMLTGRFIDAERALRTNLVSEVVADEELETAAQPYINEMLMTSPMGLRMTKEGLNLAIDAPGLEAAMAIENRNQLMCSRTNDAKEGMQAFIEKRQPVYTGS